MSYDPRKNDPQKKPPQDDPDSKRIKNILTMIVAALVFTLIINLIYTSISTAFQKKITHTEFYEMLESDQVAEVQFEEDRMLILTKEEAAKDQGKQIVYYRVNKEEKGADEENK